MPSNRLLRPVLLLQSVVLGVVAAGFVGWMLLLAALALHEPPGSFGRGFSALFLILAAMAATAAAIICGLLFAAARAVRRGWHPLPITVAVEAAAMLLVLFPLRPLAFANNLTSAVTAVELGLAAIALGLVVRTFLAGPAREVSSTAREVSGA